MQKLRTIGPKGALLVILPVVAIILILVLELNDTQKFSTNLQNYQPPTNQGDAKKTVGISLDHKTYGTTRDLREDSTVVLIGTVLDEGTTKESPSSAISGDGMPAPGLVKTYFPVRVDKILKGEADTTITVVLTGGVVNDTKYIAEGIPWPSRNNSVIMYLIKGEDGKYYPLAGGSALAIRGQDDKYILPGAVSGNRPMEVTETDF